MQKSILDKATAPLFEWVKFHFLTKKMTTPVGIILFFLLALLVPYVTVVVSLKLSISIVAITGIILLCVVCIAYPVIGYYISFFVSLFLTLPEKLLNAEQMLPVGLIPEFISYLALIGVVTKHKYRKEIDNRFWHNGITLWMVILLLYYILELVNPSMPNKFGWFNFFRKQLSFFAFFYVSYCVLNSKKAIWTFMKLWVLLSTLHALYCCKQQWFGFFDFEYYWVVSDETRSSLYINWGFFRRFGLISDPANAGILYALSTLSVLVLALRSNKVSERILYYVLALIHFLAAGYTGTRTATLMVIAGVVFYCILTLHERRTLIFSGCFALLFIAIMYVPIYDNFVINRIRSTFEGSKDHSQMVRDINRKTVQPYVYSHPIGGGINTSGVPGFLYNPGHYLNQFSADSGYMLVMMEQGTIGLLLMMISYFVILRMGIKYSYRVRDPDIKTLYIGSLVFIFTMMVAQFSQSATGQYPSMLFYLGATVIIIKCQRYDSTAIEAHAEQKESYNHE